MRERGECCGWASWGALAGMGDGSVAVEAWEEPGVEAGSVQSEDARSGEAPTSDAWKSKSAPGRHSGRRARAALALSRWKLGERNKRG